jgi:hypothetical protein
MKFKDDLVDKALLMSYHHQSSKITNVQTFNKSLEVTHRASRQFSRELQLPILQEVKLRSTITMDQLEEYFENMINDEIKLKIRSIYF